MDRAKQAVSDFMSKSGHHDTTVHESVAPHVQHETINEQRREERQVATDREVHQDHYHTSVQPVKDREILPEQHHHNLVPVEHRTHDNRDHVRTKDTLKQEAAQFQHQTKKAPVQHSTTEAPSVTGEHVHHHVHETIQPVVQKETIEPHVVHTTVPIHEVHHNAAQHHTSSALPAMSMADFKQGGGSLTGRDERTDHFAGEPKGLANLGNTHGANHGTTSTGTGIASQHGTAAHTGSHSSNLENKVDPRVDSDRDGSRTVGGSQPRMAPIGTGAAATDSRSSTSSKPSLMDKLNPRKDADGDGKKGFMD